MEKSDKIVNVFIPCCMDMFDPGTAGSTIAVLERLGCNVNYQIDQTCCGRRFYMEGNMNAARELGVKLFREFGPDNPIVIPSSACAGYIKHNFQNIFENTFVPGELTKFTENIYELSDFIVNVLHCRNLENYFNSRVFYFKSCSARNTYHLHDEPEILLRNTQGLDLVTDDSITGCCSANGTFAEVNPEVSEAMLKNVVDRIYAASVQYVTSTDIHCLQHIEAYIQAKGIGLEVIHLADILNAQKEANI